MVEIKTDGRYLRSQITRKKIFDAAEEIFITNGYQKTTVNMIIAKAKIGYGTVYGQFKEGKEEIFSYIMKEVLNQFFSVTQITFAPKTIDEAYQIINTQVCEFLHLAEKNRPVLKVCWEAIGISSKIRNQWDSFHIQLFQRIERDIQYAQSKGMAQSLPSEIVASVLLFTGEKYLWKIALEETEYSIQDIAETIVKVYMFGSYNTK
ncbi:TetR/AcrR family transcriptional regulator [Bacillus sp. 165]|uniref:TetR/AcrR family transcriptional regulator n=1 Tax=Bacillus sp. 165 TaxID=1529117 RepID=UPI001AD97E30|nr:TetR/AcrR family transcriptional regulator [Bacillus sp. 165]MBO9129268.1 TetR/AcrR family transcriptional regulator [Bacillus sp. 165]